MLKKSAYIGIGILMTVILITTASVFAVYINYNSLGTAGWSRQPFPAEHAYNSYQIDAENYTALFGPAFPIFHPLFQDFVDGPLGMSPDGVELQPGSTVTWVFTLPNDPEFKWGCYKICLVLITTNNQTYPNTTWGPNAPASVDIVVDGIWQYRDIVWSKVPGDFQTCQYGNDSAIYIDFHLNCGYGPGDPYWHGGAGPIGLHTLDISNSGPNAGLNTIIRLDEVHISSGK